MKFLVASSTCVIVVLSQGSSQLLCFPDWFSKYFPVWTGFVSQGNSPRPPEKRGTCSRHAAKGLYFHINKKRKKKKKQSHQGETTSQWAANCVRKRSTVSEEDGANPDYWLQLLSAWEGSVTCHSVISGNWKIYVAVSTLLWWKTHDWYFLVIWAKHQEAPFMYLCSEVNMFELFHSWTSLPLSVLTDTFFCSNLCPPTAFCHNMPILLSLPPLLWQALPLALHWNLNSPSPASTSCYPSIGSVFQITFPLLPPSLMSAFPDTAASHFIVKHVPYS